MSLNVNKWLLKSIIAFDSFIFSGRTYNQHAKRSKTACFFIYSFSFLSIIENETERRENTSIEIVLLKRAFVVVHSLECNEKISIIPRYCSVTVDL